MPLNPTLLGNALKTAADTYNDTPINPEDLDAARTAFWQAIATEITGHIIANLQVTTTIVTVGNATTQTGTGTGTIA